MEKNKKTMNNLIKRSYITLLIKRNVRVNCTYTLKFIMKLHLTYLIFKKNTATKIIQIIDTLLQNNSYSTQK